MKKYLAYAIATASRFIGEIEAENKEDAIIKAEEHENANSLVNLCHYCSKEVDVGDFYEVQVEEIKDESNE